MLDHVTDSKIHDSKTGIADAHTIRLIGVELNRRYPPGYSGQRSIDFG